MRLTQFFATRCLPAIAMLLAAVATLSAQGQLRVAESPQKRALDQLDQLQAVKPAAPYKVSSRFHLMEGTASGYLVVQFELPRGSYIYSMNQGGAIRPTKISVTESDAFVIDGKFTPDKPAEVIEQDPIFQQRVEKHKGKVQFFVPVKFNDVAAATSTTPEITINGQVCSDAGVCLPLRDKQVTATFGGFFGRTVEAPEAPDSPVVR